MALGVPTGNQSVIDQAAPATRFARLRLGYQALLPARVSISPRERLRVVIGAALGLALAALLSHLFADPAVALPWLIAPLGATTVLVFAAPASPMAQPWAAIAGNTVSALVGILCARSIGDPALAAGVAASLAIAAMFALRCLHPPGGAVALTAVLLHITAFRFALFPVCVNTLLLVLAGVAWHRATGRRYPHSQQPAAPKSGEIGSRFSSADFDAALARYNGVLDVSRDDLEALLQQTELNAYRRLVGEVRCADIMSRDLLTVQFGTALAEAWALMRRHDVKALPVVDRAGRIVGIITHADFLREANLDSADGLGERVKELIRSTGAIGSSKPEVVGQIMTRRVRITREDRHVVDLVAAFSEDGHHHLPVVNADGKAVGMITQSDVVRALARAVKLG
jgi:CBS domain-containing membrane protein